MMLSLKPVDPLAVAAIVAAHALALALFRKEVQAYLVAKISTKQQDEEFHDTVEIRLPAWAGEFYESYKDTVFSTEEEMMRVAVELSDRNITEKTGGPFGSAIFQHDIVTGTSKLFSIGVNRVVPMGNSSLHGEMVAIQFGQKKLNRFTFGGSGAPNSSGSNSGLGIEYHLYTSCEPCCQCLGGTLWSGVCKLVCAATKDDAEAIGFVEGPVFPASYEALEKAGVQVVRNCLRDEGARVLKKYGEIGVIYNA